MPIDYARYPPDWNERRKRILTRANHCCEFCGISNGFVRVTWSEDERVLNPDAIHFNLDLWSLENWLIDVPCSVVKIVLTIAHLDHDEENWDVKDERLAALCQRCHLRYDAPEKARRRRKKKYEQSLFPLTEINVSAA